MTAVPGAQPPGATGLARLLMLMTPFGIMAALYLLIHLGALWPPLTTRAPRSAWTGGLLVGAGLAIAAPSAIAFARRRTTIVPVGQPSALLVSGPYRFSRNPIYLADVVTTAGIALVTGRLAHWAVPIVLGIVLDRVYIANEERRLRATFGAAFEDYARRVRRWL